jgi:hypothetical protein
VPTNRWRPRLDGRPTLRIASARAAAAPQFPVYKKEPGPTRNSRPILCSSLDCQGSEVRSRIREFPAIPPSSWPRSKSTWIFEWRGRSCAGQSEWDLRSCPRPLAPYPSEGTKARGIDPESYCAAPQTVPFYNFKLYFPPRTKPTDKANPLWTEDTGQDAFLIASASAIRERQDGPPATSDNPLEAFCYLRIELKQAVRFVDYMIESKVIGGCRIEQSTVI